MYPRSGYFLLFSISPASLLDSTTVDARNRWSKKALNNSHVPKQYVKGAAVHIADGDSGLTDGATATEDPYHTCLAWGRHGLVKVLALDLEVTLGATLA